MQPILARKTRSDFIERIIVLGEAAKSLKAANSRPAVFDVLSQREYEIVKMMTQRLSNREIAGRLSLSEGSVKQYVNQIYSNDGDTRTKRKQLDSGNAD